MKARSRLLELLTLCCLVTATACSAPSAGSAAQAGDEVLTFATDKAADCWDPHVSPADSTGMLMRDVYDSLVWQSAAGRFEPWLARSWSISPDGRTYTFQLRTDVRFTDGSRFDAQAVKANFDHIVAPATKSQYAAELIGPYQSTEVLGPYRVRVRLSRPYAPFLHAVSTTYLGFHSPASLREHGADLCAGGATAVGTGPFVFSSLTRGQEAVFTRNPGYHWAPGATGRTPALALRRLVVLFLPDDSVRAGALRSGQADIADQLTPLQLGQFTNDPDTHLVSAREPGAGYTFYLNTARSALADPRVRKAVQLAFDTGPLVASLYQGHYSAADSVLSAGTVDHAPAGRPSFDTARAATLLDAAGWTGRDAQGYRTKDGHRLALSLLYVRQYLTLDRIQLNLAFQSELKSVGIQVDETEVSPAAYLPRRDRGDYDVLAFSWGGAEPDLLRTLFDSHEQFDDGGDNAARVDDAQLDRWLERAAASSSPAVRRELYAQAQRRISQEAYALPTYQAKRTLGVRTDVHGVAFDANGWPVFYGVRVDR